MTTFADRATSMLEAAADALPAVSVWPRDVAELHEASPYVSLAEAALCYATVQRADNPKRAARAMLVRLRNELVAKNASYGNSATNPVRRWSAAPAVEGILIRLDDKLSRLVRGSDAGEDTLFDFCGYLALLEIARAEETTP